MPTLALGTEVRPGEIIVAVALGLGFIARPALASVRENAPSAGIAPVRGLTRAFAGKLPRRALRRREPATSQSDESHVPKSSEREEPLPADLGPIVTDPVSLEEAWSNLIDAQR